MFNLLQNGLILVVFDESDNRWNYQKYRSWWIILCCFCLLSWKMMPYQYCKCVVACRNVCCFVGIFHSTNQLMFFSRSPGAVDGFISSFIDALQLGNLGCWFQGWNIHPMHDNIYFDCFWSSLFPCIIYLFSNFQTISIIVAHNVWLSVLAKLSMLLTVVPVAIPLCVISHCVLWINTSYDKVYRVYF